MSELTSAIGNVLTSAELGSGLRAAIQDAIQRAATLAGPAGASAGAPAVGGAGMVEKVLFLAVLRSATQKAAEAQQFNLETQMNDLWNKLGQIRSSQVDTAKLQDTIQKQASLFRGLSEMIKNYNDMSRTMVRNIRS